MFRNPLLRRVSVLLGLGLYAGLLTMAFLGSYGPGDHLHYGHGRIRTTWSDIGLLLTLIAALPVVLYAAIVQWRRK